MTSPVAGNETVTRVFRRDSRPRVGLNPKKVGYPNDPNVLPLFGNHGDQDGAWRGLDDKTTGACIRGPSGHWWLQGMENPLVDIQRVMPTGGRERIAAQARLVLKEFGRQGGGFIVPDEWADGVRRISVEEGID